jgi:4-hydroxybenzoate polyprenyltransferase
LTAPPLLRAVRPGQWTKNVFVVAPALFAQRLDDPATLVRVGAAFGIFCCASSAIYLINDILDRDADQIHPRKRQRPIAAGELSIPVAAATALVLAAVALTWSAIGLASVPLTGVVATYLVIQLLYSWRLKHLVIVDVLCIASGFVLRLLAGGFAAGVPQSRWILACTIFVSLFLALCKRRHEVVSLGDDAELHRPILTQYSVAFLDQAIGALTAATIVGYTLYTVDDRTAAAHGFDATGASLPPLLLTVPFVVYGLFRYLYLVHRENGGGSPTTTLFGDRPSLVNGALFVAVAVAILRFWALSGA